MNLQLSCSFVYLQQQNFVMVKPNQAGNDKLLSYGDNLLRRSDVDLLKGPCWLNDQVLCLQARYVSNLPVQLAREVGLIQF